MQDRQLSSDFRLSEFPGWDAPQVTEADVSTLQWTVDNILQPTRDQWGPLRVTSWLWLPGVPGARQELGGGAHADPGTVDFVPEAAPVSTVHRWMGSELDGLYGELLDEQTHIHVSRWGVGGTNKFLALENGQWVTPGPVTPGAVEGPPLELAGITVSVSPSWVTWGLVGAMVLLYIEHLEAARR